MGLFIISAMRTALVTMRGDQVLGRGDHHDPVHGDGLEDGQGHIARSGGMSMNR